MHRRSIQVGNRTLTLWEDEGEEAFFWPASGDYPIYDDFLYRIMVEDPHRNVRYEDAIRVLAPGKTVVEIGAGADALWAIRCIEAGARHVYAIESGASAVVKARGVVRERGMDGRITLIEGLSTEVALPEPVDLCVSEIIGEIGGSEGAAVVLNDARDRFLKPEGRMIPSSCRTRVAGVSLPDRLMETPCFKSDGVPYVEEIFRWAGRPFDLRVSLENHVGQFAALTAVGEFECLDFAGRVESECAREIDLEVRVDGRFDGLLMWIELQCHPDGSVLDISTCVTNWIPVFFPVIYPGVEVFRGQRVRFEVETVLSENGINPDYRVRGAIEGVDGEMAPFGFYSPHRGDGFRKDLFYQRLFDETGEGGGALASTFA